MSLEFDRTIDPDELRRAPSSGELVASYADAEDEYVDEYADEYESFGELGLEGEELGSWILEERLGAGGIGEVYRASHAHLDLTAAIKLPHAKLADNEAQLERFRREALAMMQCKHPNVIEAKEFAIDENVGPYLVMELLEGIDLAQLLEDDEGEPLDWEWSKTIMLQLCDALEEVHAQGFIHRDIKPSNLFLLLDEELPTLKLLDFGTAKITFTQTDQTLTTTGMLVGTPLYLAPEQLQSSTLVTPATDIYAMGVVLYQALVGRPPLQGKTLFEQLMRVSQMKPAPLGECQEIYKGTAIEALLQKMLAKDAGARPQNASDAKRQLIEAFAAFDEETPEPPPLPKRNNLSLTYAFATQTPEVRRFELDREQLLTASQLHVTPDVSASSALRKQQPKHATVEREPLPPHEPKGNNALRMLLIGLLFASLSGFGVWYVMSQQSKTPTAKAPNTTTNQRPKPRKRSFLDGIRLRVPVTPKAALPPARPQRRRRKPLRRRKKRVKRAPMYPQFQRAMKAYKARRWSDALAAFHQHAKQHPKRLTLPAVAKRMKACRCALKQQHSWEVCEAKDYPPGVTPPKRR